MAADRSEFHVWLCSRLKSLNLDEEVLGEYIVGILDGDDSSYEEKHEALSETLEGMMESPDDNVSSSIFMKWKECEDKKEKLKQQNACQKEDILVAVVEKQTKTTNSVNKKPSYKIDEDVKKNLVKQYGQELDEHFNSSSDEETQTQKSQPSNKGLFQNTNAKSVVEKEKEKRDKQKQESEDKKVKIKEDREKQKAKVEERKDKEKKRTQKGERRAR